MLLNNGDNYNILTTMMQPFVDRYNNNKSEFNKHKLPDIGSILLIKNECMPKSSDPGNVFLKQSELIQIAETNVDQWTLDDDKSLFKTYFKILETFNTRAFILSFLSVAGVNVEVSSGKNFNCSIGGVEFQTIVAPNKIYETAVNKLYSRNLDTLNENMKNKNVP